jgi:hypothetical protein
MHRFTLTAMLLGMSVGAMTSCAASLPTPKWTGPLPLPVPGHYAMDVTVYVSKAGQPQAEWEAIAHYVCDHIAASDPANVPTRLPHYGHGPLSVTFRKHEVIEEFILERPGSGSAEHPMMTPARKVRRLLPPHYQVNGIVDCRSADDWSSK